MDASGIITGVIIAVITGTLIPFFTTQYSLWAEHKRAMHEARRAALAEVVSAEAAEHMTFANQVEAIRASGRGGGTRPDERDAA